MYILYSKIKYALIAQLVLNLHKEIYNSGLYISSKYIAMHNKLNVYNYRKKTSK